MDGKDFSEALSAALLQAFQQDESVVSQPPVSGAHRTLAFKVDLGGISIDRMTFEVVGR